MSRFCVYCALMALFLLFVIPASGRDTAIVVSFHRTIGITYIFDGNSKGFNSNEILKDLANDAVKNLRSTRMSLDFDLQILL